MEQSAPQLLFIYANICCLLLLISNWDHLSMHFSALHGSTVWNLYLRLEIQVIVWLNKLQVLMLGMKLAQDGFHFQGLLITHILSYMSYIVLFWKMRRLTCFVVPLLSLEHNKDAIYHEACHYLFIRTIHVVWAAMILFWLWLFCTFSTALIALTRTLGGNRAVRQ